MKTTIEGDRVRVHFDSFGLDAYEVFLRCKRLPESTTIYHREDETYSIEAPARFAGMLGLEVPSAGAQSLPIASHLFDDQAAVLSMALDAKRFACWCGCGWGKTALALEYARHVHHRTNGGRGLITTINDVVPQWIEEAANFYGSAMPVYRIRSRDELRRWCKEGGESFLAITNYEKWNPEDLASQIVSEAKHLAFIILDENRLKTGGGKQKWALIKSCRGIEYKLSLTATPAPNDTMEFASQASFLEKMRSEGEIIWTYFTRDPKSHRWTVKKHARKAFFEFMASWSIYVNDPRRYGWRKGMEEVPAPVTTLHEIPMTDEQRKAMQLLSADPSGQLSFLQDRDINAIQRAKLSQVAKGFRYRKGEAGKFDRIASKKPGVVADLIRSEVAAGAQVLVWTVFDAESNLLAEELGAGVSFDLLTGKTSEAKRLEILERFRKGESRVLIARASMLGWGMNFQFCSAMIFSGWNDSFESYYQAVRRAYRYGQKVAVRVHIPVVTELEGDMLDNIFRKQDEHCRAIGEMEDNYISARKNMDAA